MTAARVYILNSPGPGFFPHALANTVDVVLVIAILMRVKWNPKTHLFFLVLVLVYMSILLAYPQRPEKGVGFPGTRVTHNCKPLLSAMN